MVSGRSLLVLPQHPDEHRPERPVLLAVDQQLGEGARLGVPPELADPVGAVEVGEHEDVEELGAGAGPRALRRARSRRSSSSGLILGGYAVWPSLHVSAFLRNTFRGRRAGGILQSTAA